jgi:hypothetical protein
VGLLAIPGTATGRAKLCDDLAKFFKRSHSERSVAELKNPAPLLLGFIMGFLDFPRSDIQIRQSERCVPNSEISPEDFLLT